MLSLSVNDVLRRGAWTCFACATVSRSPQALIVTAAAKHTGSKHQRNHSSSKASSSSKNDPRPLSTASEAPSNERPVGPAHAEKRSRRTSRIAPKSSVAQIRREAYPNIPSVPSTSHLHPQSEHRKGSSRNDRRWLTFYTDIQVASFFSHHRPISITRSFPTPSSESQFSSIFKSKSPPKTPIGDVIYTVASAIENIENAVFYQQPNSSGPEHPHSGTETTHLDAPPQSVPLPLNVHELSKKFRPFTPPPAPVPFDESKSASPKRNKGVKERTFSTTLTITEQAYPNGQRVYQAQISPMRETIPSHPAHAPPSTAPSEQDDQYEYEVFDITPLSGRQPFLERMKIRHQAWEDGLSGRKRQIWRAISVKRQRKLKMKKHKYKKLMRKTRNLRRRMDKN
ncbi:MAG: hypothetical protein Q9192_002521 [Flavoplaca navasiana]